MAGKIIADIIEAPYDSIRMNVANVTVLTANNSGLTYLPTGNVNINIGSTASLTLGNVTVSNLITANGGIKFPATQVASADVNTLDDYEEGTWTPTIFQGWTSVTYAEQKARYTKIGNQVTAWFYMQFSGTSSANAVQIAGLPFATPADPNYTVGGALTYYDAPTNETTGILIYPVVNSTRIQMFNDNDNAGSVSSNGNATNRYFIGSVTYAVA